MALTMDSEIRFVKGVGEARMKLYQRLNIGTVGELLYHVPRSYVDLRHPRSILEAQLGETVPVRGIVASKSGEQRLRKGLSVFKVQVVDDHGDMTLTFFNGKYTVAALREGEEYLFYGRMGGTLLRREMQSPAVYPVQGAQLVPVYSLTAGITSRMLARHVAAALDNLEQTPDSLPLWMRQHYELMDLQQAFRWVHFPSTLEQARQGRQRLAFEELLCLGMGFARLKEGRSSQRACAMEPRDLAPFFHSLPFTPTGAQKRAISQAVEDLCREVPMNRLVQGDVGSGKTLVAAACCYFAFLNGRQSAMMAPTELLAEQHFKTLTGLLSPLGVRVGLLTGSTGAKEKKQIKAALEVGELDLCIGTHALLTGDVSWAGLGLVVTDEQHRFGVAQRMALTAKGEGVHTLVMSATPIPRTLALIIYGDLELSVIDEMPAGRSPVETYLIDSPKRERAFGYIRQHLDRGLQGYIVCPLVEEDPESPMPQGKGAVEWARQLEQTSFRGYRLGLLHGRMKPREKEAVMTAFSQGEIQLLVATTVIEVGIDVPNAVIMMIENAERFGLSQLHQLRGRVGRGTQRSTCILLSDTQNPETRQRLRTLCKTTDGFRIAEEDLALRGPGDFFGMRQHGLPQMQVADLAADSRLLARTQEAAELLLRQDPTLESCPALARRVERMMETAGAL